MVLDFFAAKARSIDGSGLGGAFVARLASLAMLLTFYSFCPFAQERIRYHYRLLIA